MHFCVKVLFYNLKIGVEQIHLLFHLHSKLTYKGENNELQGNDKQLCLWIEL